MNLLTPAHDHAIRFVSADFDLAGKSGLVPTASGQLDRVSGTAAIRQSILMLLATMPGERVRRPEYGCELHKLAFAPNDNTTHGIAMHYLRQAITRWEPRIELLEIDAQQDPHDAHVMQVSLQYRTRQTNIKDVLEISFDLLTGGD